MSNSAIEGLNSRAVEIASSAMRHGNGVTFQRQNLGQHLGRGGMVVDHHHARTFGPRFSRILRHLLCAWIRMREGQVS